jgi:nitrite reductase (NADH) small subunit
MLERIVNGTVFLEVCQSRLVTSTKGTVITFEDEETAIAIFRVGGKLFACSNICPHQHSPILHEGIVRRTTPTDEPTITCPLHGWTFSLITGCRSSDTPGISTLRVYKVFEEDGFVYVEHPEPPEQTW